MHISIHMRSSLVTPNKQLISHEISFYKAKLLQLYRFIVRNYLRKVRWHSLKYCTYGLFPAHSSKSQCPEILQTLQEAHRNGKSGDLFGGSLGNCDGILKFPNLLIDLCEMKKRIIR